MKSEVPKRAVRAQQKNKKEGERPKKVLAPSRALWLQFPDFVKTLLGIFHSK